MVSIRLRLIALFVLLVTVTLAGFGAYSQLRLSRELEQRFTDRQKEALIRLKTSLPTALWNYDKAQTERAAKFTKAVETLEASRIPFPPLSEGFGFGGHGR